MPLDDSLTLCTRDLVTTIRGQANDTLKGHDLPVLLLNVFLQGRGLDAEELMVRIHSEWRMWHLNFGRSSDVGSLKDKGGKWHVVQE